VAVKRIRFLRARPDFTLEVESLAKLNHPCVLRIVRWRFSDCESDAEIQTEYARNGSLDRVLADHQHGQGLSFWNRTAIGILLCGIVLGMRYIHFSGVIHRDLKPENILLNEKGHPLIADFGSCHFQSDDATPTPESGTVRYAAPEQYSEDGAPTPKIDVFSFGLVLYEMLVGSPVFSASEPPFFVIRRLRARDLPSVPQSCGFVMQDLIRRCWRQNPVDRPTFHQIFSEFQFHHYNILPNAAPDEIRDFCEAIVDWEIRAGIPQ
jgi:serine/threonine protein kinase